MRAPEGRAAVSDHQQVAGEGPPDELRVLREGRVSLVDQVLGLPDVQCAVGEVAAMLAEADDESRVEVEGGAGGHNLARRRAKASAEGARAGAVLLPDQADAVAVAADDLDGAVGRAVIDDDHL